jgi:hypothetical protein
VSASGVRHFEDAVGQMPTLLEALQSSAKHRVADHPAVPDAAGIYLFSDGVKPIYVGQSRKLRTRLRQHTGATNRQNQASFAFNLAKREALRANVEVERPRATLEAAAEFIPHFDKARADVAAMDVQFIELSDPIARTLFEVYAALALDTVEFNSFETH